MARQQVNTRLPDVTVRQIAELMEAGYESQSAVVAAAVDRLWVQEQERNMSTVIVSGATVDFDAAVNLMDDEIREAVHASMAPCSPQAFLDEYAKRHEGKHGDTFVVN